MQTLRPGCITVEGIEKALADGWVEAEFLSIKSPSVGETTRTETWNKHQLLLWCAIVNRPFHPPLCTRHSHDTITASPRGYFSLLKDLSKTPAQPARIDVLLLSDSLLWVFMQDIRGVKFHIRSTHDLTTVV